jgi:cytoskeletal protein CcmA (bactofilin family)
MEWNMFGKSRNRTKEAEAAQALPAAVAAPAAPAPVAAPAAEAPAADKAEKAEKEENVAAAVVSVITAASRVVGEIASDDDYVVNGQFEGKLTCRNLTISAGARVSGEIRAVAIRVHGEIDGNIVSEEFFLYKTGVVNGSLKSRSMGVRPGCVIRATVDCAEADVLPAETDLRVIGYERSEPLFGGVETARREFSELARVG